MKFYILILLTILLVNIARATEEPNWNTLIPIIIQIESGGNPNAVSEDGCIGILQISPAVLEEFNDIKPDFWWTKCINSKCYEFIEKDLYNPFINRHIGIWYLERIWSHYLPHYKIPQTIENLLIGYNFGVGNLNKWYKQGAKWNELPKETRNYILRYKKLAGEK